MEKLIRLSKTSVSFILLTLGLKTSNSGELTVFDDNGVSFEGRRFVPINGFSSRLDTRCDVDGALLDSETARRGFTEIRSSLLPPSLSE